MNLEITLNEHEARLLGVLVEKELTTPENYPLSLNAAIIGSNQKSNRHPVVEFSEAEVVIGFTGLMAKGLASKLTPAGGGRVEKYKHTATKKLGMDPPELAVFVELLLRGPQTPGELRTRASRMSPIESLADLSRILDTLIERQFAKRLPPSSGSRAERFIQLMAPNLHPEDDPGRGSRGEGDEGGSLGASSESGRGGALGPRVATLENEVSELRRQLQGLAERLGESLDESSDLD